MTLQASQFPYLPHEDAVSQTFWQSTRERELRVQYCKNCRVFQWYPRLICILCASQSLIWKRASGVARIDSWSRVHRVAQEGFVPPYVIARVLLEEQVIFLTRLVGSAGLNPICDAEVRLTWQELSDGRALPVFE